MIRNFLATYRAAFAGLPRELWLLAFIALVNRAGSMVLPFLGLYLTQQRGCSIARAGHVLSLYGAGAILGAYLGGRLTDRIGPTRCQRWSLIASGAGFIGFSLLRDPRAILVAVLPLAAVVESFRPANMAGFAQRAPEHLQVRAFALARLAANLGIGIGPAVGGWLALHDYAYLFYADALTCWIAAALLSVALKALSASAPGESDRRDGRAVSPWSDFPFLGFMLLVVLLAMVFFQVLSTLPIYWREAHGFRENTIGLLLGLNAMMIVLFEMVLSYRAERRDRVTLVGTGALLVCAGFGLMPLSSSVGFVVLTVLVWTLGEMLALPMMNAVVAERASPSTRGSYMGMMTMAFSVAFMIAPTAGTFVLDRFGANALWYVVGALGLPLYAGFLALRGALRRRPKGRIENEPS